MNPADIRVSKPPGQEVGGSVLESGPLVLPYGAFYAMVAAVYLLSADGLSDFGGQVIGRDFINPWTAGVMLATGGDLASIFDPAAWRASQEALFGRALPAHDWSYPSHMLFVAGAVGWLPYGRRRGSTASGRAGDSIGS